MTEKEFIKGYCGRSDITWSEFYTQMVALPCNCGDRSCHGWAAVSNNPRSIKNHKDLYQGEL